MSDVEESQTAVTGAAAGDVTACGATAATTATRISEKVQNLACRLASLIEPDYGLLDQLLSLEVLLHRECDDIRNERTVYKRNHLLLACLARKTEDQCQIFLTSLEQTAQQHVVNLILYEGDVTGLGDVRPLYEDQLLTINRNTRRLTELLDPNDFFVAELARAECISWQQGDVIRETQLTADKNEKLLDILTRRSVADFKKFIDCLIRSEQAYLAQLLERTGVVVKVHAELDESTVEDVGQAESQRESQFRVVLSEESEESGGHIRADVDQLSTILEPRVLDVQLVVIKKRDSIESYFFCHVLAVLLHLRKLYKSRRLKTILASIFTMLVHSTRPVHVKRLVWSREDDERGEPYFTELFSIYQLNAVPLDDRTIEKRLLHVQSNKYLAIQDDKVVCRTLDSDPTFQLAMEVIHGKEVPPTHGYCGEPVTLFAIRQLSGIPESPAEPSDVGKYVCAKQDCTDGVEVRRLTKCNPKEVVQSYIDPRYFYQIPAPDDVGRICFESTSRAEHFLAFDDTNVFLKKTTKYDVQTHFSLREGISYELSALILRICFFDVTGGKDNDQ